MLCLSYLEVCQLTGKKTRLAQVRVLRFMGIEHRVRPDGRVMVLHSHLQKVLDGESVKMRIFENVEPDWSVFDARSQKARK